jgi:hypothetical protein
VTSVRPLVLLLLLASALGCGKTSKCPLKPACKVKAVGTLPGVTVSVSSDKCLFAVGESATFRYDIDVDSAAPSIAVLASQGCGRCGGRSEDPLTFTSARVVGTSDPSLVYCSCDVGCCPPDAARTVALRTGRTSDTLAWPARVWTGPSDTNQPLGRTFPPGCYSVEVDLDGFEAGKVAATLPIEVL